MQPRLRWGPAGGALVLSLWAAGASAEPKAEAVLRGAFQKLHAAKSYTADLRTTVDLPGQPPIVLEGKVMAMKPNFLRVSLRGMGEPGRSQLYVSTGKEYITYSEGRPSYNRSEVAAAPTEFAGQWEGEIDAFFGGEKLVEKGEATLAGTEQVGGVECDLVRVQPKAQTPPVIYAVGKSDRLIRRATILFERPGQPAAMQSNILTNIRLDAPVKAADFAFTPPAGVREFGSSLVPVGKPAPSFRLPTPEGQQLALEDTLKGKKAVLINFWFYN